MSSIDLTQFQATFFAESREGLDAMEAGLLALEAGTANGETINTIFRAAHSIKGGSATFGFRAIAETTHLLETLLDQVRSSQRAVDAETSDTLLIAVDVLRGLLDRVEAGDSNTQGDASLNARLEQLLLPAATAATKKTAATAQPNPLGWQIRFYPQPGMYATGNDPLRILRELAALGDCNTCCDVSALPALHDLDAAQAYLGWNIELRGDISRAAISEVFAWVEDECALEIVALIPPVVAIDPIVAAVADAPIAATSAVAAHDHGDSSIRVAVAKVDALINLVGELVITQAMLRQQSAHLDPGAHDLLLVGLTQLDRNTRDLQEAVMSVRMLPVEFVFSRFPRLVRDLGARLGKKVRLRTSGEGTELDKGVIERIIDPLTHLVRNAVDHGLETPDKRLAAGKDAIGTITLSASHQGGHIIIDVVDDGRGLDRQRILAKAAERGLPVSDTMSDNEVWKLIFHPGLSTADSVTDVSGRGVGMDVVKQNIAALSGEVDIESQVGVGMRVRIKLPLTLAILDGMSVAVGGEIFILPLSYVIESLLPGTDDIKRIAAESRMLRVRDEYLPLMAMADLYHIPPATTTERSTSVVVVVESEGRKLALEVDELVGQQQVVVKSIESNYRRIHGVSGATILGDGRVALIVDVGGLSRSLIRAA